MARKFEQFVDALASRNRVLLLGGLAVIAHGLSRPTKDGDIWLEPCASSHDWVASLWQVMADFGGVLAISLATREILDKNDLAAVIENDRVIRVTGLSEDLDIFRIPNNMESDDFDAVWERGEAWSGRVRVMDPLDLMVTKMETGRPVDQSDVNYLEEVVRASFCERIRSATPEQAAQVFQRYADHAVCAAAFANPHPQVRKMATDLLREFAEAGDPFARDILHEQDG